MLNFIFTQIFFYLTISLVLFLPGYAILHATYGKNKPFYSIETFLLSFGISLVTIDIAMILLGKAGIPLTATSILSSLALLFLACFSIFTFRKSKLSKAKSNALKISFSRKEFYLFIFLMFLTIFFRTAYLNKTIAPTATDLGHHMYWVNVISQTHSLPDYAKTDIIQKDGNYQISDPQKIDDFIIGEHLFIAAIVLITKINVISSFPVILLYLTDIIGILAIFVLTQTLFSKFSFANNTALFSLFLLGPLFAMSSSQANFVSGGVIGNLLGNIFIPLSIYLFYRAIAEKRASFFMLGMLTAFGLLYTHHLSAFIFIFAISATFLLLFSNPRKGVDDLKELLRQMINPFSLIIISSAALFFFFVMMPSYIQNNAVQTVIGAPTRSTKEGLAISQLSSLTGQVRMSLAFVGLLGLFIFRNKFRRQFAVLAGWAGVIFLMSWKPTLVNINIPSSRIANYLVFPAVIAGSFLLAWFFERLKVSESKKFYLKENWLLTSLLVLLVFASVEGYRDNADSLKEKISADSAVVTYDSAKYLASHSDKSDIILKDHNFISNDSWMKLFFMRDYNYPLTRSFFFRYEVSTTRETCTLEMISNPNSDFGKKCFQQTGTRFVLVNPTLDGAQFEKNNSFWKVYNSGAISTYYLKK